MIKRLDIRRQESAFSPLAEQKVLKLKPEVLSLIRENRETGAKVYVLVNVSDAIQSIELPEMEGRDLISGQDVSGAVRLNPWECAWVKLNR